MHQESVDFIHAVKTPLARIEALAERALREARAGRDATKSIALIPSLTHLIQRILMRSQFVLDLATAQQITRNPSQRIPRNPHHIPPEKIGHIINELLSDFSSLNSHRNISPKLLLPLSAGGLSIVADIGCLEQALYCVLDNAFRFAYNDSFVTVILRIRRSNFLEITVQNRGINLCAKDIPYVFQRGWRSPVALAITADGGGIGLWIARALIEDMRGTISVLPTNEKEITTVVIKLPLKQ